MDKIIAGVRLTNLKIIRGENGDVMHALKASDESFDRFGEAYFSTVKCGSIKGWKRHKEMTLNLVVPVGAIRFVIYDDRNASETRGEYNEFLLGADAEYARLTVAPGLWMAFQGVGAHLNLLLNLANIEHAPDEAENLPVGGENDFIPRYDWQ